MGSLGGWFQTDSHSRSGGSASDLESGDQGAHWPNGVSSECSFYYHGKQRAWLRMNFLCTSNASFKFQLYSNSIFGK